MASPSSAVATSAFAAVRYGGRLGLHRKKFSPWPTCVLNKVGGPQIRPPISRVQPIRFQGTLSSSKSGRVSILKPPYHSHISVLHPFHSNTRNSPPNCRSTTTTFNPKPNPQLRFQFHRTTFQRQTSQIPPLPHRQLHPSKHNLHNRRLHHGRRSRRPDSSRLPQAPHRRRNPRSLFSRQRRTLSHRIPITCAPPHALLNRRSQMDSFAPASQDPCELARAESDGWDVDGDG